MLPSLCTYYAQVRAQWQLGSESKHLATTRHKCMGQLYGTTINERLHSLHPDTALPVHMCYAAAEPLSNNCCSVVHPPPVMVSSTS